jgi:hypothetical protein
MRGNRLEHVPVRREEGCGSAAKGADDQLEMIGGDTRGGERSPSDIALTVGLPVDVRGDEPRRSDAAQPEGRLDLRSGLLVREHDRRGERPEQYQQGGRRDRGRPRAATVRQRDRVRGLSGRHGAACQ